MRISDWSSDVCSSDLAAPLPRVGERPQAQSCAPLRPLATASPATPGGSSGCSERTAVVAAEPSARALGRRQVRALPARQRAGAELPPARRRSEEHTSELQSLMRISYAVFCLKKKTTIEYYIQT